MEARRPSAQVMPNPSIERTCPGKPGHASDVKHQASQMAQTSPTFPLLPHDVSGDFVTVLSVASCASELPKEDVERLSRIVGTQRHITMFDKSGFAWLSFMPESRENSDFCLFPSELSSSKGEEPK